MVAVDPSHVFVVELRLHRAGSFAFYQCTSEISISLRLDVLCQALRTVKKSVTGTLELWMSNVPGEDTFNLSITSNVAPCKRTLFKIHQIHIIDQDTISIPKRKYPNELLLSARSLQSLVADLSNIGDKVKITFGVKEVHFSSVGMQLECSATINEAIDKASGCDNVAISAAELDVPIEYKAAYFVRLVTGGASLPNSRMALLQMGQSCPLSLVFSLGHPKNCGSLRFYLAPLLDGD
eukprot:TRINITY_DN3853_c0_g1_i1.p1 TRINITY_DN3853_c0_g1~~TRINITY_DN3853_c0_g1_i1.p1  ORF type:complete len:237 (+),score=19.99 TRINITY_DN3853_c0_g1_i1:45-755(+)